MLTTRLLVAAWLLVVPLLPASGSEMLLSTYLGSSGGDTGNTVALDADGNIYVAGTTSAPETLGAKPLPGAAGGGLDVFVAKLDPPGARLLYLVYFGGSGNDFVNAIALDGTNVCLTGSTVSTNFPSVNALWPLAEGENVFVAKINGEGTDFVFCTGLGGSRDDSGQGIAVGATGNIWVTGWTDSPEFPVKNPIQQAGSGREAFVTELSPDGARLLFSSLLGGTSYDAAAGIAVDGDDNAYVVGSTSSADFPTALALQTAFHGGLDAFVTAFKADGSGLIYSTYLGGAEYDWGTGVCVDQGGNAFVTGCTASPDFPVSGSMQGHRGGFDSFVAQVAPEGARLVFSTFLGGSGYDSGLAVQVDQADQICVTGQTGSPDFPTLNALQDSYAGGWSDAFVAQLDPANGLVYSTYLGSSGDDAGAAVTVDSRGNALVVGSTQPTAKGTQFPTTAGARQSVFAGGISDAFVCRISDTPGAAANDNLADAKVLSGPTLTTLGQNTTATGEPLEPRHAGVAGGKSVWWKWQAHTTGPVIVSTKGSDFDTVLAVYTGASMGTLQQVAANDDDPVQGTVSRLYFDAEAGATYAIAVDGKNGASGGIVLTLSLGLAPNDDFAYRIPITDFPTTVRGWNLEATVEDGEPNQWFFTGRKTVWWSWTAPRDMKVAIDTTGSNLDGSDAVALVIYTGSSIPELGEHRVASNDAHSRNPLLFSAQAGVTYQIAADGTNSWPYEEPGTSGRIVLHFYETTTFANDDFANRGDLSGWPLPIVITTNLVNATTEPGESIWYGGMGCTLWWTYTAQSSINLMLTTTSSPDSAPPIIRVFTGDLLSQLIELAAMTWTIPCATPTMNRCTIRTTPGVSYQIGMDATDLKGDVTLAIEQVTPPPNDDFAQAAVLAGVSDTWTGSAFGATYESSNEPRREYGTASIWWKWTAPTNGNVEVSSAGSVPANVVGLSVWTGDSLSTLEEVAATRAIYDRSLWAPCGTDSELVTFKASAGRTYFVAGDELSVAEWTVAMSLRMVTPPVNDDFTNSLVLNGLTNAVKVSNAGATREKREPGHAGEPGGQSLWWSWTPSTSGYATFDTTGSKVPVVVAVYTGDSPDNLQEIASNLLPVHESFHTNFFGFRAASGTTYRIVADSMGQTGEIVFSLVEQPSLRFDSAGFDAQGGFNANIGGVTQNQFVVQASTNLIQWLSLLTNSLVNQNFQFTDSEAHRFQRRFYRAVELP